MKHHPACLTQPDHQPSIWCNDACPIQGLQRHLEDLTRAGRGSFLVVRAPGVRDFLGGATGPFRGIQFAGCSHTRLLLDVPCIPMGSPLWATHAFRLMGRAGEGRAIEQAGAKHLCFRLREDASARWLAQKAADVLADILPGPYAYDVHLAPIQKTG